MNTRHAERVEGCGSPVETSARSAEAPTEPAGETKSFCPCQKETVTVLVTVSFLLDKICPRHARAGLRRRALPVADAARRGWRSGQKGLRSNFKSFREDTIEICTLIEYHGKGRAVSETWIGESIGNYTVVGYDEVNNGKKYSAEFEAYALKDIAQSQFIAVKMEDSYYVFQNDEYAPPNTLGELMDAVNLSEVVELQRFSEGDNTPDSKRFALSSDDYAWEVLSECRNAPFVEDQTWTAGDRSYLSFTITSEALGVYKVALYVTEDGYLWTNAFNYQYLFNIGEDAASKIIKYAKENSTEAEYEPYQNTIVGKITEITDEYILLDDSILCANPDDGITYKILLNDLRISRYAESGAIRVGENVQITYEGEIDESNTIDSAISASDVVISGGDVLIPE